jgi:hypothetical protein
VAILSLRQKNYMYFVAKKEEKHNLKAQNTVFAHKTVAFA